MGFEVTRSALFAVRKLNETSGALSKSFERLSSGLRINGAADDPAALAVATKLQSEARLYTQALRNMNDGISLLNVADQTLGELQQILSRQAELAEQAANGVYSLTQRRALGAEANALVDEFNRILTSTKFNGISPLATADQSVQIQAGITSSDYLSLSFSSSLARTAGSGSFGTATTYSMGTDVFGLETSDFNSDGILDILTADYGQNTISVRLGNGDGTFKVRTSFVSSPSSQIGAVADLNGDGYVDFAAALPNSAAVGVFLGNGNGTFKAMTSYVVDLGPQWLATADFNGDGKADLVSTSQSNNVISVLLGNGDGSFKTSVSFVSSGTSQEQRVLTADFNGDGKVDIATTERVTGSYSIFLGNGDGSFRARRSTVIGVALKDLVSQDFNLDGYADLAISDTVGTTTYLQVVLGNGDGSFKAAFSYASSGQGYSIASGDFNGDGLADVASGTTSGTFIYLANDNGTFKAPTGFDSSNTSVARDLAVADLNGDGVLDIARTNDGTSDSAGILLGQSHRITSIPKLNLLTQSNARASLDIINVALTRVTSERGSVGSNQSRMSIALNHGSTVREMYAAAASRITDLDVAQETAELVRLQILQQANVAVLAQANQQPQLALRLLSA